MSNKPVPAKKKSKAGLKKGAQKSTKIEVANRVNRAEDLLAQGLRNQECVEILKNEYNIQKRTAQIYIHRAIKQWEEESNTQDSIDTRNARRIMMRTELENLYEVARKERNIKDCYNILDRLCKLDGLYTPDQVDVTVHQGVMIVPGVADTEVQWIQTNTDNKKLKD